MARLSPGRVLMVKAVPISRPTRWNGLNPTQPARRERLSEMMEVGASRNPAISSAGGLATVLAAMVTLMPIAPLPPDAGRPRCFLTARMARRRAPCPSHSRQSAIAELDSRMRRLRRCEMPMPGPMRNQGVPSATGPPPPCGPKHKPAINPANLSLRRRFLPPANARNAMKIGTLLTAAIVSLSTVGGGLAVYVAVSRHQTMDRIAEAQSRLGIVRAVGDIPRYLNPERGFATNILYGPATVDPGQRTEHDKLRKLTDGARDKMNALRKEHLPGSLDDGGTIASQIDALNAKFAALREAIDKAIDGPAEARKDAARKIVADNAVF